MSLPTSVVDVIQRHVTLTVQCLERLYLNVIQPRLQKENGIAFFFRHRRGELFATAKTMADVTRPFVATIEQFAQTQGLDLLTFGRRQRKDEIAREYLAKFTGHEGILFVGKGQERAAVVRAISKKNPRTGRSYPWLQKSTAIARLRKQNGSSDPEPVSAEPLEDSARALYNAKPWLRLDNEQLWED